MAESRLESMSMSSLNILSAASPFMATFVDLTEAGVAFLLGRPPETFT